MAVGAVVVTRVLHVNKFLYRRGGAESYLLDVAALQEARGDEISYFGMDHPENEPSSWAPWFPDEVVLEPPPVGARARLNAAGRMVWSTSARRGLRHVIEQVRPDVAHLHNVYHQLSPSVVAALADAGVPMVMTVHDYKLVCPSYQLLAGGSPCDACIRRGLHQPLVTRCKDGSLVSSALLAGETWLHRRMGAWDPIGVLICPSEFMATKLRAAGFDERRLVVLPHFAASAEVDNLEEVTSTEQPPRFVIAARLAPEKGIGDAIEAMARVGDDAELHVYGDGPERLRLEEVAARSTAAGRVTFHGRVARPEIQRALAGARAMLLPSTWHENQPMSILEAFGVGCPVIATTMGGIPELVRAGDTGWLVPPAQPVALAGAMTEAAVDPGEARRRGARGRSSVLAEHSVDGHLRGLDEAYRLAAERVLAKPSR